MIGEASLIYDMPLGVIVILMAVLIWAFYFAGIFASRYYLLRKDNDPEMKDVKDANNGVTLLGFVYLLLAFTFSLSLSRYDARRTIIYQEANNIGTAILRADLYPDSARAELRNEFKDYVEARIAYYESLSAGRDAIHRALKRCETISGNLWKTAVHEAKLNPNIIRDNQMLPALNAMIDISTSRDALRLARVPDAIIYLLLISIFTGSFLIGYDKKSLMVLSLFTIMTIITIYTIMDLDRPKQGFIRSDLTHSKIVALRGMF